jgi:hypothetical protein
MKRRPNRADQTARALSTRDLTAVAGGKGEAYFVRCDRSTTTQVSTDDSSIDRA